MINQTEFAARPDVRPRQERPRFKAGAFFICTIASASWVCRALSHRACADRSVTVFVSITYPHGERLPGFSVIGVIVSEGKGCGVIVGSRPCCARHLSYARSSLSSA